MPQQSDSHGYDDVCRRALLRVVGVLVGLQRPESPQRRATHVSLRTALRGSNRRIVGCLRGSPAAKHTGGGGGCKPHVRAGRGDDGNTNTRHVLRHVTRRRPWRKGAWQRVLP